MSITTDFSSLQSQNGSRHSTSDAVLARMSSYARTRPKGPDFISWIWTNFACSSVAPKDSSQLHFCWKNKSRLISWQNWEQKSDVPFQTHFPSLYQAIFNKQMFLEQFSIQIWNKLSHKTPNEYIHLFLIFLLIIIIIIIKTKLIRTLGFLSYMNLSWWRHKIQSE